MQAKKQNPLLTGLFVILALGFTVISVLSIIEVIKWIDYMTTEGIIINFSLLVGQYFVFAIPAFALAAYFWNMDNEKNLFTAIRFSVSGWVILFIEVTFLFIETLIQYEFVFEYFLSVLLTLLPLIVTGILYKKKDAFGADLNGARIASAVYFLYLGIFNWLYVIIRNAIPSGTEGTISFILSILLGVAISGAFCYFYFKLVNAPAGAPSYSQPQQYGQQPYGQPQNPYGPQQPQQYQQNPYGAPAAPVPPVQQAPVQPQAPVTKFCPACGSQMPVDCGFCTNCGNKLP